MMGGISGFVFVDLLPKLPESRCERMSKKMIACGSRYMNRLPSGLYEQSLPSVSILREKLLPKL